MAYVYTAPRVAVYW